MTSYSPPSVITNIYNPAFFKTTTPTQPVFKYSINYINTNITLPNQSGYYCEAGGSCTTVTMPTFPTAGFIWVIWNNKGTSITINSGNFKFFGSPLVANSSTYTLTARRTIQFTFDGNFVCLSLA